MADKRIEAYRRLNALMLDWYRVEGKLFSLTAEELSLAEAVETNLLALVKSLGGPMRDKLSRAVRNASNGGREHDFKG